MIASARATGYSRETGYMEDIVTQPTSLRPDPVSLREALRGLRHALRRGGETLSHTVPLNAMPRPAAKLAQTFLRTGEEIAKGVDGVASKVVRKVLPGSDIGAPTLGILIARGPEGGADFAAISYRALAIILSKLGLRDAFVSEAGAQQVWNEHAGKLAFAGDKLPKEAGQLMMALLEAPVLRDLEFRAPQEDLSRDAVAPVALFALMLWLQSERPAHEDEEALSSAVDLSRALVNDVTRAASVGNAARLGQLFGEFARHV